MHFSDFWLRCTSLPFITCLVVDLPPAQTFSFSIFLVLRGPASHLRIPSFTIITKLPEEEPNLSFFVISPFFSCPFLSILPSLLSFGLVYLVIYDKLVSDLSVFCLFKSKLAYTFWNSWAWFRAAAFQKWVKYIFISCSRVVNFALLNVRVELNSLMLYT